MRRLMFFILTLAMIASAHAQEARRPPAAPVGLRADYYPPGSLDADSLAVRFAPLATRVELLADSPVPRGLSAQLDVRLSGQISVSDADSYVFHITSEGGIRVWIDGKKILDDSAKHALADVASTLITPGAGAWIDIRIDGEGLDPNAVKLTWSRHNLPAQPIDSSRLYPLSKPVTITTGGTYIGSWQSNDAATAAMTISTPDPVTIDHSLLRGRGAVIVASQPGAQLTVKNSAGFGLDPGVPATARGAFIDAYQVASLDVEHNFIEGVGGYGINVNEFTGTGDQTVKILYNQIRNSDGRFSDGAGGTLTKGDPTPHAIVFQHVHNVANLEIGYNEIIQDPYASYVNDVINLFESSGTRASPLRVHDNYIQGLYAIDPLTEYNSGCGIIADGSCDPAIATAFADIDHNQVVGTGNGGICIAAGHNNGLHDNRILSCGRLPAGSIIFAQNIGSYIHVPENAPPNTFFQNGAWNNLIGWLRPPNTFENKTDKPARGDYWFPEADPLLSHDNEPWPGPISLYAEAGEYDFWRSKLAKASFTLGPGNALVAGAASKVNLADYFNRVAITHDDKGYPTGLDGNGLSLSSDLLHFSLTWKATSFTFGPAGANNAVTANGQFISIARKSAFAHIRLLAVSNGNQAAQKFGIQYADGSSANFLQDLSDWHSPMNLFNEAKAHAYDYAVAADGTHDGHPCYIYAYDFPLDVSKTPASLTLPANPNVMILAITLAP
ncbi:MAG: PA14 domain-containing protein [Planctomycetota bacterium]|nr:PA14 domain-containing protein [Planctomycetota bacterium]